MSGVRLEKLGYRTGLWQGRLTGLPQGEAPGLEVTLYGGAILPDVAVTDDGVGGWIVSIPIPGAALGDGIAAFLVSDAASGDRLGEFALAVGEPADDDLRAELALIRAELDLLKRAVRRLSGRG